MAKLYYCSIFSSFTSLMIIMCIILASAELSRVRHDVRDGVALSFLVVGDWGRNGAFNQSQAAHQMGTIGEELNVDFIVSTGDNSYDDGLKSIVDPTFENSFTKVYTQNSLQIPWYSVLGNHDYRGNVLAQLNPRFRTIDERWFCLRSFIVNTEIAEFFFIDTTPFVDKYFLKLKDHRYDWRGVLPRNKYLSNLLKDLNLALRSSVANWKIVVGHHPIESVGHHGGTKELVESLLPILEENNVDVYMNGHDHCLQHITSNKSPIQFITSGGGSKAWKGDFNATNQEAVKFYYDGQGFISFQVTQTSAVAAIYDIHGRVMHKLNLFKQPYSAQ